MATPTPTDTVVLVHGLWMTPRSWEHWVPYYEAKGYRVITPAYPGVVIDSAPTEGVHVTPLSQVRSFFPALKNPANIHKAVAFTAEEFHYAFANTLSAEDSNAAWQRYAIAAPGNWVWVYGLIANLKPGHQETWVDYDQDRAPLLFIAGEKDHIMPPSVNKSNARHYENSPALTEYFEFEGRDHWTCAAPGWEAVADYALEWAAKHARTSTPT